MRQCLPTCQLVLRLLRQFLCQGTGTLSMPLENLHPVLEGVLNEFDIPVLSTDGAIRDSLIGELAEQPQKVERAYQSISDSAIGAQDRNVKFVQNTFENGMEVFKRHAESTR